MTTNKPEVVAWLHRVRQESDVITDKVRHVWGTSVGSMAEYTEPLIRLSDYEALQAECDALRAKVEALELVADTDPDDETAWLHEMAHKALTTYRKEGEV